MPEEALPKNIDAAKLLGLANRPHHSVGRSVTREFFKKVKAEIEEIGKKVVLARGGATSYSEALVWQAKDEVGPTVSKDDVKSMRVPELRRALAARGLSRTGLKPKLAARLKLAIEKEVRTGVSSGGDGIEVPGGGGVPLKKGLEEEEGNLLYALHISPEDAWKATLRTLAGYVGWDNARCETSMGVLSQSRVGEFVLFMCPDGLHFMQLVRFYGPGKKKNFNFECRYVCGDDKGKLADFRLEENGDVTQYASEGPGLEGDWSFVVRAE